MKNATFHLLKGNEDEIAYRYACYLTHQLYEQKLSVYIYCENIEIAKSIDDLLWTVKDTSFVPHQLLGTKEQSSNLAIHIGFKELNSPDFENTILINLTKEVPIFHTQYSRIVEIVLDDGEKKAAAREKYKVYRDSHYKLDTVKAPL